MGATVDPFRDALDRHITQGLADIEDWRRIGTPLDHIGGMLAALSGEVLAAYADPEEFMRDWRLQHEGPVCDLHDAPTVDDTCPRCQRAEDRRGAMASW